MLDFIVRNSSQFLDILDILFTLGLAIAALTPTKADDNFFDRLKNLLAHLRIRRKVGL